MKKKIATKSIKQEKIASTVTTAMHQLMIPLMIGAEATRKGLFAFVHEMGLAVVHEMFAQDAATLVGPKGKNIADRAYNHWGTTHTPFSFGGREVVLERPRVRRKGGGEAPLPTVEAFRAHDTLPERVMEQIILGVSTRGYDRSLDPLPEGGPKSRRTSKSATSRALIEKTTEKLAAFADRRLDELDVVAMFIDGIEVAKRSVIIALAVFSDGSKCPVGLVLGSTENAAIATDLLQSLVARGLRVPGPMLFAIDGGKGIRKALTDVFGDRAVVQRCQVHKMRNVREHLPKSRRSYVARLMRDAYKSASPKTAKRLLLQLVSWLENNDEDSAAGSLREGLDETLTCLGLDLPKSITRTFSTTNSIENLNGTIRRVGRNVKRWQDASMIKRWVAAGIFEASRRFRRVKGHRDMPKLVAALAALALPKAKAKEVASVKKVA